MPESSLRGIAGSERLGTLGALRQGQDDLADRVVEGKGAERAAVDRDLGMVAEQEDGALRNRERPGEAGCGAPSMARVTSLTVIE
jgi:hypothetical protein